MILVGILMVVYVLFGGMVATTYVQIVKAVLVLACDDVSNDLATEPLQLQASMRCCPLQHPQVERAMPFLNRDFISQTSSIWCLSGSGWR